jgi:hypothetical protein
MHARRAFVCRVQKRTLPHGDPESHAATATAAAWWCRLLWHCRHHCPTHHSAWHFVLSCAPPTAVTDRSAGSVRRQIIARLSQQPQQAATSKQASSRMSWDSYVEHLMVRAVLGCCVWRWAPSRLAHTRAGVCADNTRAHLACVGRPCPWQVDLPGGGKLTAAAIVGQDGGVWAQSEKFPAITPEQVRGRVCGCVWRVGGLQRGAVSQRSPLRALGGVSRAHHRLSTRKESAGEGAQVIHTSIHQLTL